MKSHHLLLSTRITFAALLIVAAGAVFWILIENARLQDTYLNERQADFEQGLHSERLRLDQAVKTLSQDVIFLANTPPISGIIRATQNHGYDARDGNTRENWEARLQQIFSAFSLAHPDYYKIRFIGVANNGRELVRVDHRTGKIEITPPDKLQAKGQRYYFEATSKLHEGEVFLSEFDLEQENGIIQLPKKPNFRAATPVYTPSGQLFGIVVISMDAAQLLHSASLGMPPGTQSFVTNMQGQYLLHPDLSQAFEFELGSQANIKTDFPSLQSAFQPESPEYKPLHAVESTPEKRYLASMRIHFDPAKPARFLLLVYNIPKAVIDKQISRIPFGNIALTMALMLLTSGIVLIILRRTFAPLQQITTAAERIISGDHSHLPEVHDGEIGSLSRALNTMLDKLVQREDEFRKELAESLPGIFYMLDKSGRFLMWNRKLETVLHCSADEIARSNPLDFVDENHKDFIAQAISQMLETDDTYIDAVLIAKNGINTPYHLTGRRINRNGETVLVGLGLDMSEHQRIVSEMKTLLRRNEALMQNSLEGIHIMDIDGNLIEVNSAFCNMLGYTREEALKLNVADWDAQWSHEELKQRIRSLIGHSAEFETQQRRKDGTLIQVEISVCGIEMDGKSYLYAASRDITERKQNEIVLQRHKLVVETALDGYWLTDKQGNILDANEAYASMSGYSLAELTRMHVSQLDAIDSPEDVVARVEKVMIQGHDRFETHHRRKDGKLMDMEISIKYMPAIQQFFVFCRDITERNLAKQTLQELNADLAATLQAIPDLLFDIDQNGVYINVWANNPSLLLAQREVILNRNVVEILPPEAAATVMSAIHEADENGFSHGQIIHLDLPKGESWFELSTSAKAMTDASATKRFVMLSRDITERKLGEEALKLNRTIIEATSDGFWMVDLNGKILEVNQAYADMLGYTRHELIGKSVSEISVTANTQEKVMQKMQGIINMGQAHFETRHRCKDGHIIEIEASNTYMAGANFIFCFLRDITERKQFEDTLRIAAVAFETHEAIVITDLDANIIRVNRAFSEITGYSADEVIGKNPSIMHSGRHDRSFYIEMWQSLLHEGMWAGEIWDRRKNGEVYPKWMTITAVKNEQQETTHYVAIFSDITARKRIEEEIHNLAFYDPLTKLPNRRLFLERFRSTLSGSSRRNDYGAILFIDLDRFKALNDTLGHDYGDLLLIEVGTRIKSCVREMDTVARFGGDEFVVLIDSFNKNKDEATRNVALVAEKIREALAKPYQLKEHEHHCSPSIGISLFHGNDEPIDILIEHADMAMYQVKKTGRNGVQFFDPIMQHNLATHDALENDLHHAIGLQQFRLHYQIQVDKDNHPLGAEAFLRWIHPDHGIIMPGQFLAIAEESMLIIDIGRWVLRTACEQLVLWSKQDKLSDLILTINVSAKHFALPGFVDEVSDTLKQYQVDPTRLKMELSERLMLADTNSMIAKINALKKLGIRLSMDNFASVYSSLSYLKQLSSDQLKIHQEFVQGISSNGNDAQLVKTVIDLAKSLDLAVFAEGVETEEQRNYLQKLDCNIYQGFLFGKPVEIKQFEALMKTL